MKYVITVEGIEAAPQGSKRHIGRGIMRNKGDIDKLCRSTLDALTLSAIADDSQVVSLQAQKYYCDKKYTIKPHSMITIQTIDKRSGDK